MWACSGCIEVDEFGKYVVFRTDETFVYNKRITLLTTGDGCNIPLVEDDDAEIFQDM